MNICKLLQKQIYNILSHKCYVVCFLFLLFTTIISLVHLCEVWLNGMMTTDERLLLSYLVDNIGGVSLEKRLCQYLPVDVVYTWVNGSDPLMQSQLQQYRVQLKMEITKTCVYTDCLPSPFTAVRISSHHGARLSSDSDGFINNEKGYKIILTNISSPSQKSTIQKQQVWKLYEWASPDSATKELELTIMDHLSTSNNSRVINDLHQPHWITDCNMLNVYSTKEYLMLKLFDELEDTVTNSLLTDWLGFGVKMFWQYHNEQVIVVQLEAEASVDSALEVNSSLKWRLIKTRNGININITKTCLVLELTLDVKESDYGLTRFDDKEELRYSLRSLEKYAPWVRRVYLVTNGQIPHWLNLENPKVTVVPHHVIFKNKSDLPTFSSPAIETHIHRIPGLSKKFLYFNDDLLLGSEVWPDDFISSIHEQKVYLSWPVPDCAYECQWLWVGNGVCDKRCNVSACDFDGGDCSDSMESENTFDNRNLNLLHDHNQEDDDWNNQDNGDNNMYDENFNRNIYELRNKRDTISSDHSNDKQLLVKNSLLNSFTPFEKIIHLLNFFPKLLQMFKQKCIIYYSSYHHQTKEFNKHNNAIYSNYITAHKVLNKIIQKRSLNESKGGYNFRDNANVRSRIRRSVLSLQQHDRRNNLRQDNTLGVSSFTSIPHVVNDSKVADCCNNSSVNVKDQRIRKYDTLLRRFSEKLKLNRQSANNSLVKSVKNNDTISQNKLYNAKNHGHIHEHVHHDDADDIAFNNRKIDTFAESLLHVQRIFNKVYGFKPRKVPAHMPHLVDKSIMEDLQNRFKYDYVKTSSHRIRKSDDMQFAFSYFYYLMSEEVVIPIEELFDKFDIDETGTWSDREIRTVMTRLYPLPLHQNNIIKFESYLKDCSHFSSPPLPGDKTKEEVTDRDSNSQYERYLGSTLPLITKNLVCNCDPVVKLMNNMFKNRKKFPFTVIKHEPFVGFHMISSNLSELLYTLDKIRKKPKKFLCLNDNMDPARVEDNELIRAVLLDFYHSLFPKASQFELSPEYRNRFLYYDDYLAWRFHHSILTSLILFIILSIFLVTFSLLFNREICIFYRKMMLFINRPSLHLFHMKRRIYQQRSSYKL